MTPTLIGRWQTRLLLLSTIGLLLTLGFGALYSDLTTPLALLFYVLLFGLAWDALYYFLQTYRWNRDWPPLFALVGGITEGLMLWVILRLVQLPGVSSQLTAWQFIAHYGTVWFMTFIASLGLLHILFPRWRFHGGKWLSS